MNPESETRQELAAFAAEAAAIDRTLDGVPEEAWDRPALGEWTLAELVAHIARGAGRIDSYLDLPVDSDRPARDRVSYWQTDLDGEAPAIAQRARDAARDASPADLVDGFRSAWRRSLERAGGLAADHLIQTIMGPMALDEYVATRVVELVIHHMDLRRALDLPPDSDPNAARLVAADLEALLGSPRPRNLGRSRFLLVATGRLPSDDHRFPVLR